MFIINLALRYVPIQALNPGQDKVLIEDDEDESTPLMRQYRGHTDTPHHQINSGLRELNLCQRY